MAVDKQTKRMPGIDLTIQADNLNSTIQPFLHPTDDKELPKCDSSKCRVSYTKRQWIILSLFGSVVLCAGFSFSIKAPFYPQLAISKNVSPTVYGLIFAIFELVNFITCPIYGRYLNVLPIRLLLLVTIIVAGTSCISFGFLNLVENRTWFITLSFAIRIAEALGYSAYITAMYAIIPYEFPNAVGKSFSAMETNFAAGNIVGPAAGGLLYALGGYLTPFAVVGSLTIASSFFVYGILPEITNMPARPSSALKLLKIPGVILSYYVTTAAAFSFGCVQVLLFPLVEQFKLSPTINGLVFTVSGGAYAISALGWGYTVDKGTNPKILCASGGCLVAIAFALLGLPSFVPMQQKLWLVILGLALQGLGAGGEYVCAFANSLRELLASGFPDNIEIYGLTSGLWLSALSLGSFLGTFFSGILYDNLGFQFVASVVLLMHILVVLLNCIYYSRSLRRLVVVIDAHEM